MAKTRARTDWLLSALAVLALLVWFVLEQKPEEIDPSSAMPFISLKERPPQSLTVTRDGTAVKIRRIESIDSESRYEILNDVATPADPSGVDRLVHSLWALDVLRDVPDPRALSDLGLAPPAAIIAFEWNQQRASVSLGKASQTADQGRYALLVVGDAKRVVVLSPATAAALDVSPDSLIEHRLITYVPSELRKVTMVRGFAKIELEQQENGRFWLLGEPKRRALRQKTEQLLLALTSLSVERTLEAKSLNEPASPTATTVTLEPASDEDKPQVVIRLEGSCPGATHLIRAVLESPKRRGGCINASILDALPSTATELVDDRLFFLHGDEVEKLSVVTTKARLVLVRDGAAFKLREPEPLDLPLEAGNALLESITKIRGSLLGSCGDDFRKRATQISLRSGLVGRSGPSDDAIWVAPPLPGGERQACRDDGKLLLIDALQAPLLDITRAQLRNPELLSLPFDSIVEIRIRAAGRSQRLATDAHDQLVLLEPKLPGDTASIESLKERLAQLTIEQWLPNSATILPRQTPQATQVQFWAKRENGERESHVLWVARDQLGRHVGELDNDETTFVLPTSTAALLNDLLVDRSIYRLVDSDTSFALSRGKDQIRCERQSQGFVCTPQRLKGTTLTKLIDALTQLRALRVSAATPARPLGTNALRLSVYNKASTHPAVPRFVLNFEASAKPAGEPIWTAKSDRYPVSLTYREEDLRPLLEVFTLEASSN